MLRNFVIVGLVVTAATSVPVMLESNPQALDDLLSRFGSGKVTEVNVPVSDARPERKAYGETEELSGRKVRIVMDRTGHFTGDFKINGRRINSLIDTGATLVAINRTTARRIGLKLKASDFKHRINTANGITKGAAVTIKSLQIGRIFVKNVQGVVLDDRALDGTLIGMSFLSRLNKFYVEKQALYLEQ